MIKCEMCDKTTGCTIVYAPRYILYARSRINKETFPVHKISCSFCGSLTDIHSRNIDEKRYKVVRFERIQILRTLEEFDNILCNNGYAR